MIYLLGDLQGCCDALMHMLQKIDFSPSRDQLYALGDLVNRGPHSLRTLQTLASLGNSAHCVLGNHDLHLLAAAHGVRPVHRRDTLDEILHSPQREDWLNWVRHQALAIHAHGWLMVHAGVPPQWDLATTLGLAAEVESQLRGPDLPDFLKVMYGNQPALWSPNLQGADRLRFAINALTRIRFVTADGALDLKSKEGADEAPTGCIPWFEVAGRATAGQPIAFGHWSTLGLITRADLLALDTGCIWGGALTAVRIDGNEQEIIQVQCAQAQSPI